MKIVVALDSFKGSCSAIKACQAVKEGLLTASLDSQVITCPISDGGEGFIDSLYPTLQEQGFVKHQLTVMGPEGKSVLASFLYNPHLKEALLEMAQCCGLELGTKQGEIATTYGLGQLVLYVISLGAQSIKIGLGGSATNDAGTGFAQALGAKFFDAQGQEITTPMCAQLLSKIALVDTSAIDGLLNKVKITGTCDVNNPLTGPQGATYIFGPQKGVVNLAAIDKSMTALACLMDKHYGKEISQQAGAGAAGGMGAAILWFAQGSLERGIDMVIKTLKLEEQLQDSSLVIVGEGCMDGQSLQGKAPLGVAKIALRSNIPVMAICGSLGADYERLYECGISAIFPICPGPISLQESMARTSELLKNTSFNLMRALQAITAIEIRQDLP